MSTSLNIVVDAEKSKLNFNIPKDTADEFEMFVEAAQEQNPKATKNDVLAAILKHHLGRDKAFKKWVAEKNGQQSTASEDSQI